MKKTITGAMALLVAGLMAAHGAEAKELWVKNCQKCHGADGKGQTVMGKRLNIKDYSDGKIQAELKDEAMAKAIKDGVKDGEKIRMKAYGDDLTTDDIKGLVAYFRAFKK